MFISENDDRWQSLSYNLFRMNKTAIPFLVLCLASLGLSACTLNDDSISESTFDSSVNSSSQTSDSSSPSDLDSSSDSTFSEYEGFDGYQYDVISNESSYWYNTNVVLPIGVNYHGTQLLETIQKGDIIFEANGGYGITGHTAIVEGTFFSEEYQQYYIRLIEAVSVGVARGLLTPSRFTQKDDSIYRIKDATENQINGAIDFVIGQLGKPYDIELTKNADVDNDDWYCSELIWAAYYHQGIFLDVDDNDNHGSLVTPRELIQTSFVEQIII